MTIHQILPRHPLFFQLDDWSEPTPSTMPSRRHQDTLLGWPVGTHVDGGLPGFADTEPGL